jgi:hypothetical protein
VNLLKPLALQQVNNIDEEKAEEIILFLENIIAECKKDVEQ